MKYRIADKTPPGADVGAKYGELTVVRVISFGRKARVEFRCDCGNMHVARLDVVKGSSAIGGPCCKQCNLQRKRDIGLRRFDITRYIGKTYGRLLVTGFELKEGRSRTNTVLVCRCECGAQATVPANDLVAGHTTSCGCFHHERLVERGHESIDHGHTTNGVLNGHTPLYRSWIKIRGCVSAGIDKGFHKVCHEYDPRWDDYNNFIADFGDIRVGETISRIDNQKTWCKENCFVNIGRSSPR